MALLLWNFSHDRSLSLWLSLLQYRPWYHLRISALSSWSGKSNRSKRTLSLLFWKGDELILILEIHLTICWTLFLFCSRCFSFVIINKNGRNSYAYCYQRGKHNWFTEGIVRKIWNLYHSLYHYFRRRDRIGRRGRFQGLIWLHWQDWQTSEDQRHQWISISRIFWELKSQRIWCHHPLFSL